MSRNQRPKIDEYPDYLFIVLHFPVFDKQVGQAERRRARPVRRARLRHHAPEPAAEAGRVPVRALPHERGDRASSTSRRAPGYLLYQIVDQSLRLLLPDAAQDREQARAARGGDLQRPRRGDRARHLQRQAGDHQLPQDHPPAADGAARPRAHQAALPGATSSRSTSTTSTTPRSGSGTCSRTTRRSSRRSRTRTSR